MTFFSHRGDPSMSGVKLTSAATFNPPEEFHVRFNKALEIADGSVI